MDSHFDSFCIGVVPVIQTRPKAGPKDEDRQFVALSCSWNYRYDASHVEFHVRWFRDSSDASHTFEHKFNGTAEPKQYESLYERTLYPHRTKNEWVQNPQGYEWNKKVLFLFTFYFYKFLNGGKSLAKRVDH